MAGKLFLIFLLALVPWIGSSSRYNTRDTDEFSSEEQPGFQKHSANINRDGVVTSGPLRASDFAVKYILYTGVQGEQRFTYEDYDKTTPQFIPNAPTKVLIHGFLNSGDTSFPTNVREAYVKRSLSNDTDTPEQYNVLVFDWGAGACASVVQNTLAPYRNAAENVRTAGYKLGEMLAKFVSDGVLKPTDIHLVGHSLGAHVAGNAARRFYTLTQSLIYRISALDPAGPKFWKGKLFTFFQHPYPRIHRNRVHFLDVYHTSWMYGGDDDIGDVDFYINGGRSQDSCDIEIFGYKIWVFKMFEKLLDIVLQVCSHNYATEIFAKSINDKSMRGCTGCYNYNEFNKNKCECEDTPIMGEFVTDETIEGYPSASGIVYINTKRDTKIGSNYLTMLKNNGILTLLKKGWKNLCW